MRHENLWPAFAIGAALVLVGVFALAVRFRAPANQFFGGFLVLVGGNFVANWLAEAVPPFTYEGIHFLGNQSWRLAARIFLAADPAVLLYFVSLYPRRRGVAANLWLFAPFAAVATILIAWTLADPFNVAFGRNAAYNFLSAANLGVCYLAALWIVLTNYARAEFHSTRQILRVMFSSMLIVVAPRMGLLVTDLGIFPATNDPNSVFFRVLVTWSVLALALVLFSAMVPRLVRAAAWPALAGAGGFILAITLVWVLSTIYTVHEPQYNLFHALTYSARWLPFAGFMAFAMTRYEFLDVDVKRLRTSASIVPVLGGAVAFLLLRPLLQSLDASRGESFGAGDAVALLLAASIAIVLAVATRAPPRQSPSESEVASKKRAVYKSLIEASSEAAGNLDQRALEDYRRRLGLTRQDHEDMVSLVQAERALLQSKNPDGALPRGFQLERTLASRPDSWTVLARDRDGTQVVVKLLRPEWRMNEAICEEFLREGRLLRRLKHENVVRVLDVLDQPPALVLEYAAGGSLADVVRRRGPLGAQEVVRMMRQSLAGLASLHGEGLIHRDVKPENLLVRADGTHAVADLGVARDLRQETTRARLAVAGGPPGTVLYMAPEQIRGHPATIQSDLYALAASVIFAVTGRHYLDAERLDEFELRRRILQSPPLIPKNLPAKVARLLGQCLEKNPQERPKSARTALATLGAPANLTSRPRS